MRNKQERLFWVYLAKKRDNDFIKYNELRNKE